MPMYSPWRLSIAFIMAELDFRLKPVLDQGSLITLAIVVMVVGLVTFLAARFHRQRERRRCRSHKALFRELCREHKLSGGDRGLLARTARQLQLDQASQLFVDSERWKTILADRRFEIDAERLKALRSRLFAR